MVFIHETILILLSLGKPDLIIQFQKRKQRKFSIFFDIDQLGNHNLEADFSEMKSFFISLP